VHNVGIAVCAPLSERSQAIVNRVARLATVAVRKRRSAAPAPPTLTVHQIVAYNFTRARRDAGWTQVETSDRLEPFLGYRLNQAGVSAIEKTYDSERRRNIDAAEIVAFARCFNRPISWFFLPPTGHSQDLIEPVHKGQFESLNIQAGDLTALTLGSPEGWQSFLDRVAELLDDDHRMTWRAVLWALRGDPDKEHWEQQIDLRRRAVEEVTLARLAGPGDEVITNMAQLLVELVKLTPQGYNTLRDTDPAQALALLTEGDQLVANLTREAERRRNSGEINLLRSHNPFDDLEPIDPAIALGIEQPEE
jgi:hypothetical protein